MRMESLIDAKAVRAGRYIEGPRVIVLVHSLKKTNYIAGFCLSFSFALRDDDSLFCLRQEISIWPTP
jgi:hypothetical protein